MTRRAPLATAAQALRNQGLSRYEIASALGISYSYATSLLDDPADVKRKRRYWAKLTPMQKATSRMTKQR